MAKRPPPHVDGTPSDTTRGASGLPDLAGGEADNEGTQTKRRFASRPPASIRDRPFLIILEGGNIGEMYPIRQREVVIGRAAGAAIHIEDDGVSRRHAKLTLDGGEVFVEDLKSVNGTLVNGVAVTSKRALQDGDKLILGSTIILKFTYGDDVDVTFQRRMLDAALRDGMTGAFNKRYLTERLQTEFAFAQRHKMPLSLVILDIDHFKTLNDTFGHPAGDEVLVKLADVVHGTLRKEDIFARYGGEEFVVLCRGVDVNGAEILAERLRQLIAAMEVRYDGEPIAVTISLGVAGFPEHGTESGMKLIAAADEALYEAKRLGRNRVVVKRRP